MKRLRMICGVVLLLAMVSCKKANDVDMQNGTPTCDHCNRQPQPVPGVIQYTLTVQSMIDFSGTSLFFNGSRMGFIDMRDGIVSDQVDAGKNAAAYDFVYIYHGADCLDCRGFGSISYLGADKQYAAYSFNFNTKNNSQIINAQASNNVTAADFNSIVNDADIANLFTNKNINLTGTTNSYAAVSDAADDTALGYVFAFIDKSGKKGFFTINNYAPKPVYGSTAPLIIQIKIQN